jgi:hypothetical protein
MTGVSHEGIKGASDLALLVLTPFVSRNTQSQCIQLNKALSIRLVICTAIGFKCRNIFVK